MRDRARASRAGSHPSAGVAVRRVAFAGAIAAFFCALLFAHVNPALAASEHVFDPHLSLTGTCNTSVLDEVADPSCPYPTPAEGGPHAFINACGTATDPKGYIYVANNSPQGEQRIDVFKPDGELVTEIAHTPEQGCRLDVDSAGRIYVAGELEPSAPYKVFRYTPNSYPPSKEAGYGAQEVCVDHPDEVLGVAIDPTNDHLYVAANHIREYNANCELLGGVNEIQRVAVDATGGTFELGFNGLTGPIAFDAPATGAGSVQEALEGLAAIAPGDVVVSGPDGGPWTVEFTGALSKQNISPLAVDGTGLAVGAGNTLNCTDLPEARGSSPQPSYAFQWLRNGAPIAGAGSAIYTLQAADAGAVVQCRATATNTVEDKGGGFTGVVSFTVPAPIVQPPPATAPPSVPVLVAVKVIQSAELVVGGPGGQELTCDPQAAKWTGSPSFAYRWYRNGSPIEGAGSSSYVVSAADLSTRANFQCVVTATNGGGTVVRPSGAVETDPFPEPQTFNVTNLAVPVTVTTATAGTDGTFAEGAQDVDVWHAVVEGEEHFDVYASGKPGVKAEVRVYNGEAPHELEQTIPEVAVTDASSNELFKLAVDQANGDVYITEVAVPPIRVNQFCRDPESGGFGSGPCSVIEHSLTSFSGDDVAVDGSPESPNHGDLFIAANTHLYAFAPLEVGPPVVSGQSVSQVTRTAATLHGTLDPAGVQTDYRFEYVDQASFEASGFETAKRIPLPDGSLAADASPSTLSASISGLTPGASYRFRLVAANHCKPLEEEAICETEGEGKPGEEGEAASFATYPVFEAEECPNEALRLGPSANLPDCRAYELVTPADSGGRVAVWASDLDSSLATPDGESLLFGSHNGALPGLGGNGAVDAYLARRGPGGWQSANAGPSAAQAHLPFVFLFSPDHGYSDWLVNSPFGGSLDTSCSSHYLRNPDGSFELLGRGSLGEDPTAVVRFMSAGASHVVFETGRSKTASCEDNTIHLAKQLEPDAPPEGTSAVYDRSPGGPTHVVSLLPGDVTPSEDAEYAGASADGSMVLFSVGHSVPLYARIDNASTVEVAGQPGWTFAGTSEHGDRVFYLEGGDIFACEVRVSGCAGPGSSPSTQIGSGGESEVVNISADGSRLYFASKTVLTGEEANDQGAKAEAGEENLYLWDAASETIRFLATVTAEDVTGVPASGASNSGGLGLWTQDAATRANAADDPSRTTPDGSVLLFQSRAKLTPYDNAGHIEVYRYDADDNSLACLSCNPTGEPASSDAKLQSLAPEEPGQTAPIVQAAPVASLGSSGKRAFFQSDERLALRDTDGLSDVYEWEANGEGGCKRAAGCVELISAGPNGDSDYLYAATPSGDDVFIRTVDSLVAQDSDGGIPSIYDARVGGGFPPPTQPNGECLGEACQPAAVAPDDQTPASSTFSGVGNAHAKKAQRRHKHKRKGPHHRHARRHTHHDRRTAR